MYRCPWVDWGLVLAVVNKVDVNVGRHVSVQWDIELFGVYSSVV